MVESSLVLPSDGSRRSGWRVPHEWQVATMYHLPGLQLEKGIGEPPGGPGYITELARPQ
jgi:hypothetical protein